MSRGVAIMNKNIAREIRERMRKAYGAFEPHFLGVGSHRSFTFLKSMCRPPFFFSQHLDGDRDGVDLVVVDAAGE